MRAISKGQNEHNIAITGIGEVPVGRFPDRTLMDMALTVARQAIADAGLAHREIDAILMGPTFSDAGFNADLSFARLVDELGMRHSVQLNSQVNAGGSTGVALLKDAEGLIRISSCLTEIPKR